MMELDEKLWKLISCKLNFKHYITRFNFQTQSEVFFQLYRNFEFYIKNSLVFLIEKHLLNTNKECGFWKLAKKFFEETLNIKILDCKNYFLSINYEELINFEISFSKIFKREIVKKYIIGDKNLEDFEELINDKTRNIRNNYAHGLDEITKLYPTKMANIDIYKVSILLDNIEKQLAYHCDNC